MFKIWKDEYPTIIRLLNYDSQYSPTRIWIYSAPNQYPRVQYFEKYSEWKKDKMSLYKYSWFYILKYIVNYQCGMNEQFAENLGSVVYFHI